MIPTQAPGHDPDPMAPLVALDGVRKRYAGGTVALEGIGFAVQAGEFISLVGPSGCGKSTVLRLIAGLGEVTAGTGTAGARRHGLCLPGCYAAALAHRAA